MLVAFTYLVTKDVVETLQNKCKAYIDEELALKIRALEEVFLDKFWQYTPQDSKATVLTVQDLETALYERYRYERIPCISLDRIYAPNTYFDYTPCFVCDLSVTRITNAITGEKRIGQRYGNKSVEEQIDALSREFASISRGVSLIDCGAFEGDTLVDIINRFKIRGVNVERVYLAVASYDAVDKLSAVCTVIANNVFNFKDWVELRDLFGIDGRKVSETENMFIPYWENLTEWASIPADKEKDAVDLCKKYNQFLLDILTASNYPFDRIGKTVKYRGRK